MRRAQTQLAPRSVVNDSTSIRQALIPTLSAPATSGFASFSLARPLLRALEALEFTEPRPIQTQALPAALAGRDVLGLAQTGTGKTAAFALPILQRLLLEAPTRGEKRGAPAPRALVVAPTRELASQIQNEFARLGRFTPVRVATIFGGVPQGAQVRALRARPEVVVACPGRLLDLLTQRALTLESVEVLVLDEADHMFDMGFLPDLRRILAAVPKRRQNLMFSATMPREVRKLADEVLRSPQVVELSHDGPPETIDHALVSVIESAKTSALERLLAAPDFHSAIVFLRTKRRAKRLAERLSDQGHRAVSLQGNLSQAQRERAMEGFRAGRFNVLVATDIAARGIDVARISHVINFDLPTTPEAYTHRIGRTGRSETRGFAFSFATPEDSQTVRAIERHLGEAIARVELPGIQAAARATADLPALGRARQERVRSTRSQSGERGHGRGEADSQRGRGNGAKGGKVRPRASASDSRHERSRGARAPLRATPMPAQPAGPAFGAGVDAAREKQAAQRSAVSGVGGRRRARRRA